MTVVGPVCHIPPETVTNQHGPVGLPAIPPAQPNVQSLTATVNQMRLVIQLLAGQRGQNGPQGAPGQNGQNAPAGSWTQTKIVTETVRVFQNNDPKSSNWVDVERVNKLVMGNKQTNQTWTFNRPPDPNSN